MKTRHSRFLILLFSATLFFAACHGSGKADSETDSTMISPEADTANDNTGHGINGGPGKDTRDDSYDTTGEQDEMDTTSNNNPNAPK